MRDNAWLAERVEYIWGRYFPDIPHSTPVKASFGRRSYRRLGSIALRPMVCQGKMIRCSSITVSSWLCDEVFPDLIIDQVVAHELVHYVHGFGSDRPRHLKHPHQGGVITKEFQKRGLWELYRAYQAWMKVHYKTLAQSEISY